MYIGSCTCDSLMVWSLFCDFRADVGYLQTIDT